MRCAIYSVTARWAGQEVTGEEICSRLIWRSGSRPGHRRTAGNRKCGKGRCNRGAREFVCRESEKEMRETLGKADRKTRTRPIKPVATYTIRSGARRLGRTLAAPRETYACHFSSRWVPLRNPINVPPRNSSSINEFPTESLDRRTVFIGTKHAFHVFFRSIASGYRCQECNSLICTEVSFLLSVDNVKLLYLVSVCERSSNNYVISDRRLVRSGKLRILQLKFFIARVRLK